MSQRQVFVRALAVGVLLFAACASTDPEIVQGNFAAVMDDSFSAPMRVGSYLRGEDLAGLIAGALTQKLEAVDFMDTIPDSESKYDAVVLLHLNDTQMHGAPDGTKPALLAPIVEYRIRRDGRDVLYGSVSLRPLSSTQDRYTEKSLQATALEVTYAIARDLVKTGAQPIARPGA